MNEKLDKDICAEFRKAEASKVTAQIIAAMIQSKDWSFSGETSIIESFNRIYQNVHKTLLG